MRKLFVGTVALLTIAFIIFSLAEIEAILATLRQSNPLYLLAAVGVEVLVLVNSTIIFIALYNLVGLSETRRFMFLQVTASTFVNIITPVAGVGGIAIFLDTARQRGQSTGKVLLVGVLYLVYEYASLFAALAVGFVVLYQRHQLNIAELIAAGFLVGLACTLSLLLAVGYRSTHLLGDLLAWLAQWVNRLLLPIRRKKSVKISTAYNFSNEMADGFAALHTNRRKMLIPLGFALLNKILLILILGLAFLAMGTPVNNGTIIAGFSIGHLFLYASPTPSGIGFVDSILPAALRANSVPLASAVLVTLVYRAVTFWLPLVLGAFAFRRINAASSPHPDA
jgi:glycosyltransferase 2 family protein